MDAAQVAGNLADDVKNFTHRESHVAPLTVLEPAQQREAMKGIDRLCLSEYANGGDQCNEH